MVSFSNLFPPQPPFFETGKEREANDDDNRGEWCNVEPAGFGTAPTTKTNNTHVDAIVWVKPGGESDGQCGMAGAPRAGEWFDEYAQMLVKNADPSVFKLF